MNPKLALIFWGGALLGAPAPAVSNIAAIHHDGQTFITWTDAASGAAGANYRYKVYRSLSPIIDAGSLAAAVLVQDNVFNNSGQMVGQNPYTQTTRQDGSKTMSIIQQGACGGPVTYTACGTPLAAFTGLAVHTATADQAAYYAVITHDRTGAQTDSPVVSGSNATTASVSETIAPRVPLKTFDSHDPATRTQVSSTSITGTSGLPVWMSLHASAASGCGSQIPYGDLWQWWDDATMGYQEGIQRVFAVWETHSGSKYGVPALEVNPCDTQWKQDGTGAVETLWYGYLASQLSSGSVYAYNYTESELTWLMNFAISHYGGNPNKVYSLGQSMGGWGSAHYSVRHPEIFAAIFASGVQFRETIIGSMPAGQQVTATASTLLPDGVTTYLDRQDSVAYFATCPQMPFFAFGQARQDTSYPLMWENAIAAVNTLVACRAGFAFAWNNGVHGDAPSARSILQAYYQTSFAKNVSYPAFTHGVAAEPGIFDNWGSGDRADGALSGCHNCGFTWTVPAETASAWSSAISNSLNAAPLTVDITPRNTQMFHPQAGQLVSWSASTGQCGSAITDGTGGVTASAVTVNPGAATTVTFSLLSGGVSAGGRVSLSGSAVLH